MRVAAGKLKQRIAVQEQTVTEINGSRIPGQWTDVYETWASVKSMRGARKLEYQQVVDAQPFDILLRYNNDIPFTDCTTGEIKRKYRLVQKVKNSKNKRTFTIHEVDTDEYEDSYKMIVYLKN